MPYYLKKLLLAIGRDQFFSLVPRKIIEDNSHDKARHQLDTNQAPLGRMQTQLFLVDGTTCRLFVGVVENFSSRHFLCLDRSRRKFQLMWKKIQFRWFRNFLKSEIIRPRCCRKISRILVRGRDSSSLRTWSSSRTSTHSRRTTMTPPSLLFGREARCYSGKHVLLIFVPNVFFLRTCDNLFVKFVLQMSFSFDDSAKLVLFKIPQMRSFIKKNSEQNALAQPCRQNRSAPNRSQLFLFMNSFRLLEQLNSELASRTQA